MIVYGIDPGVTGALACIVNGTLHAVADMPTREEGRGTVKRRACAAGIAAQIREWRGQLGVDAELAIIERVAARPGQGVASMFSLGHSAGVAEAVMLTLGVRVDHAAPASWKSSVGAGKDKATSQARASVLYPSHAGQWARAKDHNRAEAVLLAHYGLREMH